MIVNFDFCKIKKNYSITGERKRTQCHFPSSLFSYVLRMWRCFWIAQRCEIRLQNSQLRIKFATQPTQNELIITIGNPRRVTDDQNSRWKHKCCFVPVSSSGSPAPPRTAPHRPAAQQRELCQGGGTVCLLHHALFAVSIISALNSTDFCTPLHYHGIVQFKKTCFGMFQVSDIA